MCAVIWYCHVHTSVFEWATLCEFHFKFKIRKYKKSQCWHLSATPRASWLLMIVIMFKASFIWTNGDKQQITKALNKDARLILELWILLPREWWITDSSSSHSLFTWFWLYWVSAATWGIKAFVLISQSIKTYCLLARTEYNTSNWLTE